jgi:phosphonoacetate hydrolase
MDRRSFLATAAALAAAPSASRLHRATRANGRVVGFMIDGFDPRYFDESLMPTLARWRRDGFHRNVLGTMPSVTNVNNATINSGMWPSDHGITGNSYLTADGTEAYMESAELMLAPTLFERMNPLGVRGALLSSKKKTIGFLKRGSAIAMTPEDPDASMLARYGAPPPIYSGEINHYTLRMAIDLLKTQPTLGVLYVHTTDYPMHMWAPDDPRSNAHLTGLDALLAEMESVAPDAMFCLTADHGMNAKRQVWDLGRVCESRGVPIRDALSTGRDKYLAHHAGHSGSSFVYTKSPTDVSRVRNIITALAGVEQVLTRAEAVERLHLRADRIGDLVVIGDRDTVFGKLDAEHDMLPADYRNHGSLHELQVPLIIAHANRTLPAASSFTHSRDMLRWLWEAPATR